MFLFGGTRKVGNDFIPLGGCTILILRKCTSFYVCINFKREKSEDAAVFLLASHRLQHYELRTFCTILHFPFNTQPIKVVSALQFSSFMQPEPEFRPPMSEVVQALVRLMQRASVVKRHSSEESGFMFKTPDHETADISY